MSLVHNRFWFAVVLVSLGVFSPLRIFTQTPPAPPAITLAISNSVPVLTWQPFPAISSYKILSTDQLGAPFAELTNGTLNGMTWVGTSFSGAQGFYQLQATPLDTNALLISTLLNRIAYGPTPDELERVTALGPEAYIEEQLAPEAIIEQLAVDEPVSRGEGWQFVSLTGTAADNTLYIYLTLPGQGYVDDIRLVPGTNAAVGINLVRNGDFETPLTNDWTISPNHAYSSISTAEKHSGNSSLHLQAVAGGTTQASAIWQNSGSTNGRTYTLSYWYKEEPSYWSMEGPYQNAPIVVRMSSSGQLTPRLDSPYTKLLQNAASIDDLRAWHITHAVKSKKQLLEIMLQFLENHFVTEYDKTQNYFDQYYDNPVRNWMATRLEFKENQRWRQALQNPKCTFYDLLRISAESPAMIIYLDTVNSRGDGTRIANENYARELLELFTFGVDNGYDQNDITVLSRAWTGWTVRLVDEANQTNPFSVQSSNRFPNAVNGSISNLVGVWSYVFRPERHHTAAKSIFPGKRVPDRFGAPYAGRAYDLTLPARTGTNGIQDGFQVLAHLADQPFTQEYLSVKLCRLFVHDDFELGYDFTDPNLSDEGKLVRACMAAWENGSPKGQVREVLRTIFNSELFRSHGGSLQKIKTPLEFVVSAVRAFRSVDSNGVAATADTDGALSSALLRMGNMGLFDRAEPDGYPEAGPPWISAGTLAERLRFTQALLLAARGSVSDVNANTVSDPVALLKRKLPATAWNDTGAIADYFLSILYPGEGKANLDQYRSAAIKFLDTADNGTTASPLVSLQSTTTTYNNRIRGMAAMLMTLARFQEQ